MHTVADAVASFRQRGLKITPQRRGIFWALLNNHSHPTVEEIYQDIASELPDVSRTTVYNTLRELVALGEVVEIDLGDGKTRYDINAEQHHHLHCLSCHALVDIQRDFDGLELSPEETAGYQIVGRRVVFDAYCPNCQQD